MAPKKNARFTAWTWDCLCLATVLVFSACAERGIDTPALAKLDTSDWSSPKSALQDRLQSVLSAKAPTQADQLHSANWWELLGNPELSALVSKALAQNPSLSLAKTRIEKAQSLAGLSRSATLVQVDVGLEVSRQLYSQNGIFPPPIAGSMVNMGSLQTNVNWNPDLMGARAAQLRAAIGEVKAQEAQSHYAQLQMATQVTLTFINLASWVDQADLARQQRQLQADTVALLEERVAHGLDNRIELTQAQSDLKDRDTLLSYIQAQVLTTQHQLAVLTVQDPLSLEPLTPHLANLKTPQWPAPLGLNLLTQRADLRAAQWRVQAALGQVESAKLNFYPNVNLGLFAGYNSIELNQLLRGQSLQYGLLPSVSLPILDGGRLRAQLFGRESERDGAIAQYNETLLEAVKECANALSELQSIEPQLKQTTESLALARKAQALSLQRREQGLTNLQPVLGAKRASLNKAQGWVTLQAKALSAHVTLINALGGGYSDPSALALLSH